jgi:deoxyribose-phosphate aldolase
MAVDYLAQSNVMVSTVIGFPHGGTTTRVKSEELEEAMEHGCNEFDIVMNIGLFLSSKPWHVMEELRHLTRIAHPHAVKVILETGYLNDMQIAVACNVAEDAGAVYVKTSTGFGPRGATEKDIWIMQRACGLLVKASGGIRTQEEAMNFADLGCKRLGFGYKSAITILENNRLGLSETEDW